jgi:GT2 family glycosyltransferase
MAEGSTRGLVPAGLSVSAVVVTYRTGPVLFECLLALADDPDIAEIIVVNNGNPAEAVEAVRSMRVDAPWLNIVGEGKNIGFAAGVNLGAKHATGDRLLILNPDAVLQPGSIAALESARARGNEPMVVGGKIVGEDGAEQRGGRRRRLTLASGAATFLGMSWLKVVHPAFQSINRNTEPEPPGPIPVGAVSGALMYMSNAGFQRLGGFDEAYFLHVEDLDLCRRAEWEGGSVIYTPFASAMHAGGTSDAPAMVVEQHKAAGLKRYFRKFARSRTEKAAAAVLSPLIGLAITVRAWARRR